MKELFSNLMKSFRPVTQDLGNGRTAVHQDYGIDSKDRPVNFMPPIDRHVIELFEAPTVSANGTPGEATNLNRAYADVASSASIFINPTVTDEGTRLNPSFLAPDSGGVGVNVTPADSAIPKGAVYDAEQDHLVKITNLNTLATLDLGASMFWHESDKTLGPAA